MLWAAPDSPRRLLSLIRFLLYAHAMSALLSVRIPLIAVAVAVAVAAAGAAQAGPVTVRQGWTRPAAVGGTAAGYMVIVNASGGPDALVAAASPVADTVGVHESKMSGMMMTMRPVAALPVPARGTVALAPGGYHLMFEGLRRPLKVGDTVPVVLTFKAAGKVATTLAVRASPP